VRLSGDPEKNTRLKKLLLSLRRKEEPTPDYSEIETHASRASAKVCMSAANQSEISENKSFISEMLIISSDLIYFCI
jgi:hypothetical protein